MKKSAIFFALFACYLALAPGTTIGRGYVGEEVNSGNQMLAVVNAWIKGKPASPMVWSRHGPIPVLLDLPFLKLGKYILTQDFILSLQPILLTAGMLSLMFIWLRKIASPAMSLLLTLIGAFTTMLWPYAYIGLETKQSFFVFLVGYLALANGKIRGWAALMGFAVAGGLSLSVKSTGIVFWPALAFLIYVQFRDDWRTRRLQIVAVSAVIAAIWVAGKIGTNFYWDPMGGGVNAMRGWLTDSPILIFSNAAGIFGSPTKGLALFAPVLIVCIYAVPRAFRSANRNLCIFVFLITACITGLMSLLVVIGDEVWGPRYIHVAIAPLLLCIGAAWPRLQWKIAMPIVTLGAVGLVVSFLGSFTYYGEYSSAMMDAGQNTMEWISGDPIWSQPVFDARLVRTWMTHGTDPVPWTATHIWVWEPPKGTPMEWRTINLRTYANPQSVLLKNWHVPLAGTDRTIFRLMLAALIAGPLLMLWVAVQTLKDTFSPDARNRW